jgi:hypothetical protein
MMKDKIQDKTLYYRLVALWVVCEAFAGGIMHGIKLPFAGMIVSGMAVTCIILIGWYVPSRTAIIKAAVLVAIFKLMLSPYSPPTAYIAVFFQGCLGQLLLSGTRSFNAAAIALGILSLVESAIQRLLVLVILYGNDLLYAVNTFLQKLVGGKHHTNYSLLLGGAYILVHAAAGFFVGAFAVRMAKNAGSWRTSHASFVIGKRMEMPVQPAGRKKTSRTRALFLIIWLLLAALFVHARIDPKNSWVPPHLVARLLLRSVLILLSWYLIAAPLAMLLIKKMLAVRQIKLQQPIREIVDLLPETKYIFTQSWILSKEEQGLKRIKVFWKILLLNILGVEKNNI